MVCLVLKINYLYITCLNCFSIFVQPFYTANIDKCWKWKGGGGGISSSQWCVLVILSKLLDLLLKTNMNSESDFCVIWLHEFAAGFAFQNWQQKVLTQTEVLLLLCKRTIAVVCSIYLTTFLIPHVCIYNFCFTFDVLNGPFLFSHHQRKFHFSYRKPAATEQHSSLVLMIHFWHWHSQKSDFVVWIGDCVCALSLC